MERYSGKVAFVGFGEVNSPRDMIEEMCRKAFQEVQSLGVETMTTGVVTDDPKGEHVKAALADLRKEKFDLLIICLAGWIPSHAVISITDEYKDKPMILWGLAGSIQNGRIVTTAAQAGTTALRGVFDMLGYKFRYIYSIIGNPSPLPQISDFISAAFAARSLSGSKIGMMGFRDMKLYNTLYEGLSLKSNLGIEVEFFEMLEMQLLSARTDENEITDILAEIKNNWHFTKPVDDAFLRQGIAYFLAIKSISEENGFHAVSLKDVDGMKKILQFPPAFVFMLLADRLKLCTIPENDVMGAVTQLVVRQLTGQSAAYLEFYEFFESSVLMGVPDYVPREVVDGPVQITSSAFGQISGGLLNISAMKTGPLTIVRLSNRGDQYLMHVCTGTAKLRAWEEAGWEQPAPQLPSLEVFLDKPVAEFAQHITGQHYIIAYGDHTRVLRDFCYLKNINLTM